MDESIEAQSLAAYNLKRYMHRSVTAALFTIARIQKQPKCSLSNESRKKMWYIYTMEYCSVIKRNELIPFATMWIDLETVILNEVR